MNKREWGIASIVIAAFAWASMGIFTRLLQSSLNQFNMVFVRNLIALVILLSIMRFGKKEQLYWKDLNKAAVAYGGITFFLIPVFLITAFFMTSVANVILIFFSYPIINLLAARIFLKEETQRSEWIATTIGMIGIILIFSNQAYFFVNMREVLGMLFALGAAIGHVAFTIMSKRMRETRTTMSLVVWGVAVGVVFLLPFSAFINPTEIFVLGLREWVLLILFALSIPILSHLLYVHGLKYVRATTGGLLTLLEPVIGIGLAYFILGEVPALLTIIGGILILVASGAVLRK